LQGALLKIQKKYILNFWSNLSLQCFLKSHIFLWGINLDVIYILLTPANLIRLYLHRIDMRANGSQFIKWASRGGQKKMYNVLVYTWTLLLFNFQARPQGFTFEMSSLLPQRYNFKSNKISPCKQVLSF